MSEPSRYLLPAAAVATVLVITALSARQPAFVPVTDAHLRRPPAGDWLRWRRDSAATGYSPLDRIDRTNVGRLRLAWSWAMGPGVQEQEPLAWRGLVYLPHPNGVVQALDGRTGELIWEYRRPLPAEMHNDTVRNIAIYGDRIYVGTQDAHLVALDARTGAVSWDVQVGNAKDRVNFSAGPIAADGRVFSGLTCGVGTSQACFLAAHDAATGKELWRRESVAGPQDPPDHNATWGDVPYERRRKASFWLAGSYDHDLRLVYWTTASPYPYPEILRGTGTGALLYTNAILAVDADTGAIRWFFQMQPRDNFDMDHQDNPILADVTIGGATRKAVFVVGKPGFAWAFDRGNGAYLWHSQLVASQNLYSRIDPETGAITMNETIIPRAVGVTQMVCPGMRGGKLFQAKAYSPQTQAIYTPVSNACTNFEVVPLEVNASGVRNDRMAHMPESGGKVGRLVATSATTGKPLWTYDQRAAMGSVLATGGRLVFAGDLHRAFRAFDADSGRVLWETPLSGSVSGYPISYAAGDRQYVAVAVGGGTSGQRNMAQLYPELKTPAGSNVLMVFTVDTGDTGPSAVPAAGTREVLPAGAPAATATPGQAARAPVRAVVRGYYSEPQARRGETHYRRLCASCHGATFTPDDFSPGLTGAAFDWRWKAQTVRDLYDATRKTMPPDAGGSLDPVVALDIVAFLLQANGFPAGPVPLTPDGPLDRLPLTR